VAWRASGGRGSLVRPSFLGLVPRVPLLPIPPPPLLSSAFLAYEMKPHPLLEDAVIPFSPSSPLSHLRGAPRLERSHAGAPRGIKGRSKC